MKKPILLSILALILFVAAVPAQKPVRITFKRGAKSATATGTLFDQKYHRTFLVKVKAGQTLTTESIGSSHPITILLKQPDGTPFDADLDLSCHSRHEVTPTVAGDYKIIVTECNKADPWKGTFRFKVTVR